MARRCSLTGVGSQSGNNVSHSNHKTRTRFLPNLQHVSLMSEILGVTVSLRVTAATLRSIEHNGGLDSYLLKHSERKLTAEGGKLKRQLKRKLASKAAAA
jgi:large subunit ribosomal protein L28